MKTKHVYTTPGSLGTAFLRCSPFGKIWAFPDTLCEKLNGPDLAMEVYQWTRSSFKSVSGASKAGFYMIRNGEDCKRKDLEKAAKWGPCTKCYAARQLNGTPDSAKSFG
jgi:hypothetical protein